MEVTLLGGPLDGLKVGVPDGVHQGDGMAVPFDDEFALYEVVYARAYPARARAAWVGYSPDAPGEEVEVTSWA